MASSPIHRISLIAAVVALLIHPSASLAGKDHCRTLMIEGSAGDTSTDSVVFQIVDSDGSVIIDQSCQVTVQESEDAASLGERLPLQWFYTADTPCLDDDAAVTAATKPNGKIKYPKKICSESSGASGPSCKVKFTYKVKKSTGEVKKGPQLDICCYEGPACKGAKWGTATANPINLQIRNNSVSLAFLPTAAQLPATVGATSDLVVDPIGIDQLPAPEIQECRRTIASEVKKLTERMYSVLGACHVDDSVTDQSVCNTLSPTSDPSGSIATAVTALRQDIRDACAALGSPAKFSYAECPTPCASTITEPQCVGGPNDGQVCRTDAECDSSERRCSVGTLGPACLVDADCTVSGVCLDADFCAGPVCSVNADCDTMAGNGRCVRKGDGVCKNRCTAPVATAGNPCGVDSECDSAPGAGDGRCADWAEVADCAACLAQTSIESEMLALFGPSGSTISKLPGTTALSPGGRECKTWLVQAMGQLLKTELKEIASCQKLIDAGKIALPPGAKKCKNADRKGKRAKAAAIIKNSLLDGKRCGGGVIAELDSCGSDALTLGTCAVAAAEVVTEAFGVAAVPDSRCGDGKRIGEQCDDGNTADGDGCASDCTCEGTCGDGLRNPLPVCGEFCDDGNSVNGDGCDNNCTPTGCGNGIVTTGEQCESDADCSSGVTCNSACGCGPLPVACPSAMIWEVRADGGVATSTELELGWTGLQHGSDGVDAALLKLGLDCGANTPPNCGACVVTGIDPAAGNCRCSNDNSIVCQTPFGTPPECGGATCQCYLTPPLPVYSAGTPTCSLRRLASDPVGTWDVEAGIGSVAVDERTVLHLGASLAAPCPTCSGDTTANDGVRDGTCSGGANAGNPCDINGSAPPFGQMSYDCFPNAGFNVTGAGIVEARTEVTGSATLAAILPCSAPLGFLDCFCAACSGDPSLACNNDTDCALVAAGTCTSVGISGAPTRPNDCTSGFACTDIDGIHGQCASPIDSFCDGFLRPDGSGIVPCASNNDCVALGSSCPSGSCGACSVQQPRRCFVDPILAAGTASPTDPVLVGLGCIPPTTSSAINAVSGLPGPARWTTQQRVTFE